MKINQAYFTMITRKIRKYSAKLQKILEEKSQKFLLNQRKYVS